MLFCFFKNSLQTHEVYSKLGVQLQKVLLGGPILLSSTLSLSLSRPPPSPPAARGFLSPCGPLVHRGNDKKIFEQLQNRPVFFTSPFLLEQKTMSFFLFPRKVKVILLAPVQFVLYELQAPFGPCAYTRVTTPCLGLHNHQSAVCLSEMAHDGNHFYPLCSAQPRSSLLFQMGSGPSLLSARIQVLALSLSPLLLPLTGKNRRRLVSFSNCSVKKKFFEASLGSQSGSLRQQSSLHAQD